MGRSVLDAGRIVTELARGEVAIVALHGEHDLSIVSSLEAVVSALVEQGHAVVVDVSEATFIDLPVMGVLLRAERLAADRRVGFAIASPDSTAMSVRRLLAIVSAQRPIPLVGSRAEAVAAAEAQTQSP